MFGVRKNDEMDAYLVHVDKDTIMRVIKYARTRKIDKDSEFEDVLKKILEELKF